MSVALRGSAVIPSANPTTGFSVTIDAAVVAGDSLFLPLTSRDSVGAGTLSVTDNDTGGNTWTKIGNSTDHKATLWWKRATSGTAGKSVTVANAVGSCSGVLKAFSGALTGATPYADIVIETNASGDESHAGFTPSNGASMLCASVHNYGNDNAVSSLSFATAGATTMTEKLSTGGSDCACAFGHVNQNSAPAATGTLTWAQTDGTTYSITWSILPEPISGSTSATLGAVTVEGTGTVANSGVEGTLSATLGALTLSGTGTVLAAGVLAATLGALFIPGATTHVEDSFTDTSGTAIASHTPTPTGTSWASGSSGITIEGNRARGPLSGDGRATASPAPAVADYDVAVDVIGNGATSDSYKAGVRGRDAGGFLGDCYEAYYDKGANQWKLDKWTGFSQTNLGTYAETWTSGTKRLVLRMAGTSIKVLIDGTERISVTDSSISSIGKGGLYVNAASDRSAFEVDNFKITSGTAGATGTVTGDPAITGSLSVTLGAMGALACGQTTAATAGWSEVTPGDYDPDAGSTDNFGFNGHVVRHPIAEHVYYATADYNGLWRSYDFGRTWTKISTSSPVNIANGKTWFLAIAPDGSEMVIGQGNNTGGGEYKKTIKSKGNLLDLGVSWSAVSADLGFEPYGMDYDPGDKTRIVATAHENDTCYISTDGGVTFTSIGAIGSTSGAANYAYWGVSTNTIIAIVDGDTATGNGIRRATFSAGSWSSFSYVQEGRHQHGSHQLHVDRTNNIIVCPTALGYYRSTDDGASWTSVSSTPGSSAIATATKIYGGNSYATRGTLSGGPQLQDAPYTACTPWTSRSDPTGLTTNGPVRGTTSTTGLNYVLITANWREGLWRYVEPVPLSGSLAVTLGTLTAAGTGTVEIAGVTSATLGTLTSAATGTVEIQGTTAAILSTLTLAGTGTVDVIGAVASTLGALTVTGTGAVGNPPVEGTLAVTLGTLTAAATGTVEIQGVTAATLGAMTAAGAAMVAVQGVTAATLGPVTATATGAVEVVGNASVTLGALTLVATGSGSQESTGTLAVTLGTLTATGTGTVLVSGTSAATLGVLTSEATATVAVQGASAITLGALTVTGTGTVGGGVITGVLDLSLGAVTLAATGAVEVRGVLAVTLGALEETSLIITFGPAVRTQLGSSVGIRHLGSAGGARELGPVV